MSGRLEALANLNLRDFLRRSFLASLIMGFLATLYIAYYAGLGPAWRYLSAFFWMIANLMLLAFVILEFFGKKRLSRLLPLVSAKLFWLAMVVFLAAALHLRHRPFGIAFLGGLVTPLAVIILRAAGLLLANRPRPAATQK